MNLSSSDLELISDGGTAQIVGIRFQDVTIPQGTTVLSAVLEFETDQTDSGATSLTIRGQDVDDAAGFTGMNSNISNRTTTSASVAWSPGAWNTVNERHRSPSIVSIVQEIVDRPGWASGNDMVFIFTGSGERTAESHNGESPAAPILRLEWDGQESIPGGRICYGVADSNDRFVLIDTTDGTVDTNVGDTGGSAVEAITLDPDDFAIYGADGDRLGRINFDTGEMITLTETFGTGGGSAGNITFDDVDSLAFDPDTGILWGVDARGGSDALFQIDPLTGAHVEDAFGAGTDYLLITGTGIGTSIDDIAIDPSDGTLYASDTTNSQLITVNTSTGVGTAVGGFGGAVDMEGMGFRFDGVLYGTALERVYSINTTTGAATQIGSGDTLTVGADYEAFECHFTATSRALVDAFERVEGPEGPAVAWRTRAEDGTAGYLIYGRSDGDGWQLLSDAPTPALGGAALGATYLSPPFATERVDAFLLVEIEAEGRLVYHGPFSGQARGEIDLADAGRPIRAEQAARSIPEADASIPVETGHSVPRGAKVLIRETGIHRLSEQTLAEALDLGAGALRRVLAEGGLALEQGGQEVAWTPAPDGDGLLFYAEAAADTALEEPLVDDPFVPENVYFLSLGPGRTMRHRASSLAMATPGDDASFEGFRRFEHDVFAGLAATPDPDGDYWFWHAFSAGTPGFSERTVEFEVGAPADGPALLALDFFGVSDAGPHHVELELGGQWIGEVQWSGRGPRRLEFEIDGGDLEEGVNELHIRTLLDPSTAWSFLYLDGFEIRHRRGFRSDDGQSLRFRTPEGPVRLEAFDDRDIAVFDIEDPRRPILLRPPGRSASTPGDLGTWTATVAGQDGNRALAITPSAMRQPIVVPWRGARDLGLTSRRTDLLILAPPALVGAAKELADFRRGQGLEVRVVDLEGIYDTFSHGLETPWAIRDYLHRALGPRGSSPRFVLLLGFGSFDHRDLLGHGRPLVPGLLTPGPGGLFQAPWRLLREDTEAVIGRLPVTGADDVEAYLDRLRAHETTSSTGRGLVIADRPAPGADFLLDAQRLASAAAASTSTDLLEITAPETPHQALAAWQSGLDWLSFVGHGSSLAWGSDGFLSADDLGAPGGRRPVVLASTCLTNRDDFPGFRSFGGSMVLSETLGAMAVIAPSGTIAHSDATHFQEHFWNALAQLSEANTGDLRLGDVLAAARSSYRRVPGAEPGLAIFTLLGDPSLLLPGGG